MVFINAARWTWHGHYAREEAVSTWRGHRGRSSTAGEHLQPCWVNGRLETGQHRKRGARAQTRRCEAWSMSRVVLLCLFLPVSFFPFEPHRTCSLQSSALAQNLGPDMLFFLQVWTFSFFVGRQWGWYCRNEWIFISCLPSLPGIPVHRQHQPSPRGGSR